MADKQAGLQRRAWAGGPTSQRLAGSSAGPRASLSSDPKPLLWALPLLLGAHPILDSNDQATPTPCHSEELCLDCGVRLGKKAAKYAPLLQTCPITWLALHMSGLLSPLRPSPEGLSSTGIHPCQPWPFWSLPTSHPANLLSQAAQPAPTLTTVYICLVTHSHGVDS